MKNFARVLSLLMFMLASAAFAADTLEVFALMVQFQEEKTDNSLTTGTGVFDSDKKEKDAYTLDPPGRRGSAPYWMKHFEFANNYYKAVSGGNLVVKGRVFPDPSSGKSVYTLKKQIIDYNRTSKMKGEKSAEFDEARSRDYLTFIYDAIAAAAEDDSKESPFRIPVPENGNVKRAYMIIHAGANSITDGGSKGANSADTPADFVDVYINGEYWSYLVADSAKSDAARPLLGVVNGDTASVGIYIPGAAVDTVRSVMVMSETASQDGLNWGVNGLMVYQIGRELGMPDTYDVVKMTSRLGYYDLMDFAGYNAGNGFMPAMPAAWERMYMGWANVKEVRPTAGKSVTVDIAAAGSGLGTDVVKVPLNGNEYLLIENRQRSWNKDGEVTVGFDEQDSITEVIDSLANVFNDSTCTAEGKCKVNRKKASGIIVKLSSYDAGIPASGITVWKVNDWYLRENLQYGVANFWAGDTFRDHQFGISLVEADCALTIGKTFKNALGQDTYDYGSGTDLLPHKRVPSSSSSRKYDVVKSIGSTGYANTATTFGGYTGLKITVDVPKDAREEKTANAFGGDSVINYAAPVIRVTIGIDDGSIEGSSFPKNVGVANAVRGAVFVDYPESDKRDGEKAVVFAGADGTIQVMDGLGDSLFAADTSVDVKNISLRDSVRDVPLYRVGPSYGPLVGIASDGNRVFSLHDRRFVLTKFASGMFPSQTSADVGRAVAGPVVTDGGVWFATEDSLYEAKEGFGGNVLWETAFPVSAIADNFVVQDMASCKKPDGGKSLFVVGSGGRAFELMYEAGADGSPLVGKVRHSAVYELGGGKDERFRVACTDVDRNDTLEVFFVGSHGTLSIARNNRVVTRASLNRGNVAIELDSSSVGVLSEFSGMAIGDVNGDKYPEVVVLGDNLVYALDRYGLPISGFPVKISRGTPVVGFLSDPVLVDVTGDEIPEILVPSSDGLLYAYTGKGKQVTDGFPIAAGVFEAGYDFAPMSVYVADAVPSKASKGPELYAFHRNFVSAFRLPRAVNGAETLPNAWMLPAAGNERTGFFDATVLGEIEKIVSKDEIREFFIYPNPVRGGEAKARYELGAAAKKVTLEMFDITGLCVFRAEADDVGEGRGEVARLDLSRLGSDVYTARLKVEFKDGKKKQKLYRVGVIR